GTANRRRLGMSLPTRSGQPVAAIATDIRFHAAVAARAYAKWVARGRPEGAHPQDWLEAEAELGRVMHSHAQQPVTSETLLGAVLASTLDAVIAIDPKGLVLLASDSVEAV